jgi:REP-associated tyrosine transposase
MSNHQTVKEDVMSEIYQNLSHSKWNCKYHVVFVPKGRRKVLFGKARRHLGMIFHALAQQKECRIIEGHVMPDHVHMGLEIPPKHPVASVIGFLKGKSSIAIARQLCGQERNFTGEHFWARGYAVSQRLDSNSSKFANTSASKNQRMDRRANSKTFLRRASARRPIKLGNCL